MPSQLDIACTPDLWTSCRTLAKSEKFMALSCRGVSFMEIRSNNFPPTCLDHSLMHTFGANSFPKHPLRSQSVAQYSSGTQEHQNKEAFPASIQPSNLKSVQFDVVIVGAGIIGLSIAHRVLQSTNLSVALVDAACPCAGATGAGQGYVWLGHRTPDTMAWQLAKRSKYLWEEFAQALQAMGLDPLVTLGFKKTGSLLFGTSSKHALALQKRAEALNKGGVQAEFLNSAELMDVESQLYVGAKGSAILTPDDCQIDAHLAASYILREIQKYCPSGRFQEFFNEPSVNFLWAGQVKGILTNRREIYCNKKLVMAAGAWSGQLMQGIFDRLSLPHVLPTKPRKGHLLVLEGLSNISLKHGLMEYAYKELEESSELFGIASTATVDAKGRVLLGSSRQFAGFDYNLQYDVMENILKKAADYLPALASLHLSEALNDGSVRVGHRPYVPDGRPMIGEVAGLEGLLLATGHEGEGLSLSLGTAEVIVNLILEEENPVVDVSPFLPTGRLIPSE